MEPTQITLNWNIHFDTIFGFNIISLFSSSWGSSLTFTTHDNCYMEIFTSFWYFWLEWLSYLYPNYWFCHQNLTSLYCPWATVSSIALFPFCFKFVGYIVCFCFLPPFTFLSHLSPTFLSTFIWMRKRPKKPFHIIFARIQPDQIPVQSKNSNDLFELDYFNLLKFIDCVHVFIWFFAYFLFVLLDVCGQSCFTITISYYFLWHISIL